MPGNDPTTQHPATRNPAPSPPPSHVGRKGGNGGTASSVEMQIVTECVAERMCCPQRACLYPRELHVA